MIGRGGTSKVLHCQPLTYYFMGVYLIFGKIKEIFRSLNTEVFKNFVLCGVRAWV